MALEESSGTGMYMPVAPAYGMGNGNGFGFGGDWAWIILLLVLCGGWNNGFGGGFGGGMMPFMMGAGAADGGFGLYPWLNNSEHISDGFRDQMLGTQVSNLGDKICSGFGDVQLGIAGVNQAICQTGNGITAAVTGAQNAITQQMYTNQIADLERSFAAQTASTQGMTALQSQLAQCCCDNRLATESLRATVLQENCADRYEASNNTRDIITNATANTQAILDKLCALELDGYRRENDQLRTQLNMANLAASQTAQTAQIKDGQNASVAALVNELRSCPIPAQPVYGNQPIFSCPNNYYNNSGCGCGCGCGVAA